MTWVLWLKKLILPPSGLLLLGFVGLMLWCTTSFETLGVILVGASLLALYLLSIPAIVTRWLRSVDCYPRSGSSSGEPLRPKAPHGESAPEAIVILDGGRTHALPERGGAGVTPRTLERLAEGARAHRQTHLPILVTGYGDLMARTLEDSFEIEAQWIDNRSCNTHQNAQYSAEILRREGIERVVLVTHFWHLHRALAAFDHAGLKSIPIPAGRAARLPDHVLLHLVPDIKLLSASYLLLHEWIGIVWYRIRYRYDGR